MPETIINKVDLPGRGEREVRTVRYPSTAALADGVTTGCKTHGKWGSYDWDTVLREARTGSERMVAPSDALLAQIETTNLATHQHERRAGPVGAYAVVGDYLAGRPDSMRRVVSVASDTAPVRVMVETGVSAGVTHGQMEQRGIAILALIRLLAAERPVTLTVVIASGDGRDTRQVLIDIPAAPLELATAAHALADADFTRRLGYTHLLNMGCRPDLPWSFGIAPCDAERRAEYDRAMRLTLNLSPQDIFIPGLYVNDPMLSDPLGWLARELHRVREGAAHDTETL